MLEEKKLAMTLALVRLRFASPRPAPALSHGERIRRCEASRVEPLNRSSRRESALTSSDFRWSGLTSAATRFMGRVSNGAAPDNFSALRAVAAALPIAARHTINWRMATDKARQAVLPLPGGEGRGEGGRRFQFHRER